MNGKTAKLLRRAARAMDRPVRSLKKFWRSQPPRRRAALRQQLKAEID